VLSVAHGLGLRHTLTRGGLLDWVRQQVVEGFSSCDANQQTHGGHATAPIRRGRVIEVVDLVPNVPMQ